MNREDELLKEQLDKYSIYRKRFIEETKHDDIHMVILRAHMYIEKEMVELTNTYFKHPNKLKDYGFKSRLDLLFALGVIDKELYDPIGKINKIRNDISHKLDFKFTEDKYKMLYNSLSNDILKEFKKDLDVESIFNKDTNFVEKTRVLLSGIWTDIKTEVLVSFKNKQILAKEYEEQANNELMETIKEQG